MPPKMRTVTQSEPPAVMSTPFKVRANNMFHWHAAPRFDLVCLISASLGLALGFAFSCLINGVWDYPQLWIYIMALGVFHLTEFFVTARYNTAKLTMGSFLLTNGPEYLIAVLLSLIEAGVTKIYLPWTKRSSLMGVGLVGIIAGQYLRARSMIHAAQSFSHRVQFSKLADHVLVTDDVYGLCRHPSYAGYFLWSISSLVLLGNPVCTILYTAVLYMFFSSRIAREEDALVVFFGRSYIDYKKRVHSGIPFVP